MQKKKLDFHIGVRTTKELIEDIDEIASKNHRTRADEIRKIFAEYIEKHKGKQNNKI